MLPQVPLILIFDLSLLSVTLLSVLSTRLIRVKMGRFTVMKKIIHYMQEQGKSNLLVEVALAPLGSSYVGHFLQLRMKHCSM